MRCSCPQCDTYMVHAESTHLGCVCPECNARCKACLGTNTVLTREQLKALKEEPLAQAPKDEKTRDNPGPCDI